MQSAMNYTKLRNNVIIVTLCFAIIPMLLIGIFIPMQFTDLYYNKTVREVENVAHSKGRTIDIFLEERISQLRTLANMYTYDELVTQGKLIELLPVLHGNSQSYVDLGIIDLEGRHVSYAGSYDVKDANYKKEVWFAEVQRRGVYISDVFMGFRQFPHIIIAVMRREGNKSWILRATIDSELFNSIVQSSNLSSEGDAFVINKNNVLQTSARLAGAIMTEVAIDLPKQNSISFMGKLHNKEMLFARIPLTQAPWLLIVAEDPTEHMSLLFKAKLVSASLIVCGIAALFGASWLTTRYIVGKLEQSDKEKAVLNSVLLQSNKMAALGKLAAGVAHEINNPLMIITQAAGWIKDVMEDENPAQMKGYNDIIKSASMIEQNTDRAKTITHRLLGFARKVDPTTESIPLNPIVEQVIGFLQNEAMFRNISINKAFAGGNLRITTDIGQLQQVLLNVIDNAIDAAPNNGVVTITTGKDDKNAFITIADNGPGIPDELLANIFDPFFTTKVTGEGTGLGLSICYSIMENLGGSIDAHNVEGGGAEFTVRLPLSYF